MEAFLGMEFAAILCIGGLMDSIVFFRPGFSFTDRIGLCFPMTLGFLSWPEIEDLSDRRSNFRQI